MQSDSQVDFIVELPQQIDKNKTSFRSIFVRPNNGILKFDRTILDGLQLSSSTALFLDFLLLSNGHRLIFRDSNYF